MKTNLFIHLTILVCYGLLPLTATAQVISLADTYEMIITSNGLSKTYQYHCTLSDSIYSERQLFPQNYRYVYVHEPSGKIKKGKYYLTKDEFIQLPNLADHYLFSLFPMIFIEPQDSSWSLYGLLRKTRGLPPDAAGEYTAKFIKTQNDELITITGTSSNAHQRFKIKYSYSLPGSLDHLVIEDPLHKETVELKRITQ